MSTDRSVLLSVRPEFADALLAGTKTAEVRRRFPAIAVGTTLYVYASSPSKQVIGTLRTSAVHRVPRQTVWDRFKRMIGIDRRYLDAYLHGVEHAAIIEVDTPSTWTRPVSLAELRAHVAVEPPQSYRYLNISQAAQLESVRASTVALVSA
ncbi:ASCH domain-containing protein [Curtobacterium sp. MCPF17_002]|uniref:ASCH domain-containing protein n=1 Tax=Curtobacterium sp. MCPF17_002 TaxID=2175645 RepID=UPI000DA75A64|nr:ASCH domain-containing protein [Curtobacterium sp. MCPF17_002]WIB77984.1 ASCH domain-containing protein [Curtobacterium sp. MCPF17_002]